ncbi:MAG: hypothetical protein PWQ55_1588 [Chloroflexota bacterium]|nr:hypothetical protein [Chloroflexota bacterium]
MKRILIDTDTAAPEVVALCMALKDPALHVEAITTLMGKVPAPIATRNTLLSIESASTYQPPVYMGVAKPMFRAPRSAAKLFGADGLAGLPAPQESISFQKNQHAVDAIIAAVRQWGDGLELLCLGPLTNLALAVTKAPEVMRRLRRIILAGSSAFEGNAGPMAEFNVQQDAEAADIVFNFGVPLVMLASEAAETCSTPGARRLEMLEGHTNFHLECCRTILRLGEDDPSARSLALSAPLALAVLADEDLVTESFPAYSRVETQGSALVYGATVNDRRTDESHPFRANASQSIGDFNCQVVHGIDGDAFWDYLLGTLVN